MFISRGLFLTTSSETVDMGYSSDSSIRCFGHPYSARSLPSQSHLWPSWQSSLLVILTVQQVELNCETMVIAEIILGVVYLLNSSLHPIIGAEPFYLSASFGHLPPTSRTKKKGSEASALRHMHCPLLGNAPVIITAETVP